MSTSERGTRKYTFMQETLKNAVIYIAAARSLRGDEDWTERGSERETEAEDGRKKRSDGNVGGWGRQKLNEVERRGVQKRRN